MHGQKSCVFVCTWMLIQLVYSVSCATVFIRHRQVFLQFRALGKIYSCHVGDHCHRHNARFGSTYVYFRYGELVAFSMLPQSRVVTDALKFLLTLNSVYQDLPWLCTDPSWNRCAKLVCLTTLCSICSWNTPRKYSNADEIDVCHLADLTCRVQTVLSSTSAKYQRRGGQYCQQRRQNSPLAEKMLHEQRQGPVNSGG